MMRKTLFAVAPRALRINRFVTPTVTTKAIIARSMTVSLEEAKKMPKRYKDYPNDTLLTMAMMGDQEAREERLIREIMSVDNVNW